MRFLVLMGVGVLCVGCGLVFALLALDYAAVVWRKGGVHKVTSPVVAGFAIVLVTCALTKGCELMALAVR